MSARSGSTSPTRFFKVDPAWRRLPVEERAAGKEAFAEVVEDWARPDGGPARLLDDRRPPRRPTSSSGRSRERYDDLVELGAALNGDAARRLAETPYSYLATTKAVAVHARRARARQGHPAGLAVPRRLPVREGAALVRAAARGAAAGDGRAHPRSAREFSTIHNHTTYSFGIDDQEFMTAFECDEPADFMHLMLTLRETRGVAATPSATRRSSSAAARDPRGARPPRRRVGPRRGLALRLRSRLRRGPPTSNDKTPFRPRHGTCAGRARRATSRSRRRQSTTTNASASARGGRRRARTQPKSTTSRGRGAVERRTARAAARSRSRRGARARACRRRTRSRGRTRSARAGRAPSASTAAAARRSRPRSARRSPSPRTNGFREKRLMRSCKRAPPSAAASEGSRPRTRAAGARGSAGA